MNEYHKIETVFKRDPNTKYKTLLLGEYAHEAFGYLVQNAWTFTEKVDGTNIRVMIDKAPFGGKVTFGGRTDNAQLQASLVQKLQERFLPQQAALSVAFPNGACFYGEGYGAGIQKGGNYRMDQDFVLFDIKIGDFWLQRYDVDMIAGQFGLDVVPIIGGGSLPWMVEFARRGFKSHWGDFMAEGIVARPACELTTRNGTRIITKIKHLDFANDGFTEGT